MKAELKAKWIDALWSGAYEQGRGELYLRGRYCCLGVLCVVADIDIAELDDNYFAPVDIVDT